jgi:hypothetical protein
VYECRSQQLLRSRLCFHADLFSRTRAGSIPVCPAEDQELNWSATFVLQTSYAEVAHRPEQRLPPRTMTALPRQVVAVKLNIRRITTYLLDHGEVAVRSCLLFALRSGPTNVPREVPRGPTLQDGTPGCQAPTDTKPGGDHPNVIGLLAVLSSL